MLLKYEADIETTIPQVIELRRQIRPPGRVRLMREELHRFFRAARGAGVRVSPAESIDAMKAVADVGFAERGILRDTLLLTLAKSQDEKQALGDCFDLFFSQPEVKEETAPEDAPTAAMRMRRTAREQRRVSPDAPKPPELGELAQMLMSRDRNAIAAAMAAASNAASLSDIRYFTQRGIFSSRILEQLGIERLRDDLDALTATNSAEAERLAAALEGLARKRARGRQPGAGAVRPRGNRKPAQRDPAQRAAGPARTPAGRADEGADPRHRAAAARALQQAAQAPAARPSRHQKDAAAQRRLGRRAVPHLMETASPRPAENRGDLRRLGIGGAGVRLLPAADPQPARGGRRRPLVRVLGPPDRSQRHPRHQVARRGDERDHVEGRLRLVRLWRLVPAISKRIL